MSTFNEKLNILITANGSAARAEFQKSAKSAHDDLGKMEGGAAKFGSTMTKAGVGMMATGGVMVAAAMKMGGAAAQTALDVGKLQRLTGGSAKDMSILAHAAQQTGVDIDAMGKALNMASKNIVAGKWDKLGIDTKDAAGNIRPLTELLGELSQRLSGMSDGAEKNALILSALGRSGGDMMNMMRGGPEQFAAWSAEAEKFGLVIDDSMIGKAREMKGAQRDLEAAGKGLTTSLGQSVIPMLTSLANAGTAVSTGLTNANKATGGAAGGFLAYGGAALVAAGAASSLVGMAIKMKTNFTAAGNAMSGVGAAKFGVAAAGLLVVVGYAEKYNALIKEAGDANKANSEKALNSAMASGYAQTRAQIDANLKTAKELDDQLANSHALWDENLRRQWQAQRDAMADSTNAAIGLTTRTEELVRTQGLSADAAWKQANAEKDKKEAVESGLKPVDDMTESTQNLTDAVEYQTRSVEDAQSAITAYYEHLNHGANVQMDYEQSVRDVAKAFKDNGTQMDWMRNEMNTHTEAGAANYRMLETRAAAIIAMGQKEYEATGSTEAAGIKVQGLTNDLRTQLGQMGLSKDAIDKVIFSLGLMSVNWKVAVDTSDLDDALFTAQQLEEMVRRFGQAGAHEVEVTAYNMRHLGEPGFVPRRASGGPVKRGATYLVGEQGPELFTAPANGNISSNGSTQRQIAAMQQILSRNYNMNDGGRAWDDSDKERANLALLQQREGQEWNAAFGYARAVIAQQSNHTSGGQVAEVHTHIHIGDREIHEAVTRHEMTLQGAA